MSKQADSTVQSIHASNTLSTSHSLTSLTDANLDEILRLGGEDIIAESMRRFPDDRRLTVCGNVALRNLRNRKSEMDQEQEKLQALEKKEEAGAAASSSSDSRQ